jgi:hypothetical protein
MGAEEDGFTLYRSACYVSGLDLRDHACVRPGVRRAGLGKG